MTDEEKKAAELAAAEQAAAQAKEKADAEALAKAELEAETEEEKVAREAAEAENLTTKIDYKAELEKERERVTKAEKALAEQRFKTAEQKRKEEDAAAAAATGGGGAEQPLTASELQRILATERQLTQKQLQQLRISELARNLASSDDEAELIQEIHKNRTFPDTLSLEEQIEEAYVIANRKRLMGENSELKRALRGKAGATTTAVGTHHDAPQGSEPQMSAPDRAALVAVGFTFNGVSRRWEKKLKNGDTLVRDPKTKQTSVIKKAR